MAFRRIVEMKVGTDESSVVISGLDISFDINRTRKFADNTAAFKIYNPKEDTISRVLKQGNSVTFKAGYEDEGMGLIYVGQIILPITKIEPPNIVVSLECNSVQNANTTLEDVLVSLSYKKGVPISRPIEEVGIALGLSLVGVDNAVGIIMENGYTLSGTAKDAMRYIQSVLDRYGVSMFVDNTTLTISKNGQGNNLKAVVLSPDTGLLEAPTLTDNTEGNEAVQEQLTKRVIFKSILNYKVVPNGYVRLISNSVNGDFIVDKCSFKGNNFGGAFEVSGEGIGA